MWTILAEEASAEGISTAQFIREAALIRGIWLRCVRDEIDPSVHRINELIKQLRD
jgi:hypothetical protein